ncbi:MULTISPECIES: factor H binding protein domain-containing protein [unclassified Neisseria]|uniref:factor H binding protein domain-containing protein n=1 Tax=unclassified Neisseria TaxID=2623750 RepID=UPI0026657FBF|nr:MULTISPECIES: factor H binding protein domain-containing protein [unclassified Neisseria]MDO1510958.1 factor H binding family protein [Neisseria sp. MVDL19-042950]MDO1517202.1 factor H binding family protein [Neisseria sp. MVDL18-041461]MDO1564565.1 factor H binding family protein [Neisseria sp. MVDL20-010259]
MSIHKKIGLATIIALGLAACGGGGGGTPSTASTATAQFASANQTSNAAQGSKAAAYDENFTINLGGKAYKVAELEQGKVLTLADADSGESSRIYRQQYSIITSSMPKGGQDAPLLMTVNKIRGAFTQVLPTQGTYNYQGKAFSRTEEGALAYSVNFDKGTGSGKVSGFKEFRDITLQEAKLGPVLFNQEGLRGKGFAGKTDLGDDYRLALFGKNAEEIGGMVYHSTGEIGVAGKLIDKK